MAGAYCPSTGGIVARHEEGFDVLLAVAGQIIGLQQTTFDHVDRLVLFPPACPHAGAAIHHPEPELGAGFCAENRLCRLLRDQGRHQHILSQSLRHQLEQTNIRVMQAFLPLVDTPMTRAGDQENGRPKTPPSGSSKALRAQSWISTSAR